MTTPADTCGAHRVPTKCWQGAVQCTVEQMEALKVKELSQGHTFQQTAWHSTVWVDSPCSSMGHIVIFFVAAPKCIRRHLGQVIIPL